MCGEYDLFNDNSSVGAAGIVVLTGVAAHDHAGPGVVLSYTFGAIAAMLTAFCYAGMVLTS